jgi:hypothetical protein
MVAAQISAAAAWYWGRWRGRPGGSGRSAAGRPVVPGGVTRPSRRARAVGLLGHVVAIAAIAPPAAAQPIYVDFGNTFGVPTTSPGYHAGASGAGPAFWNNVNGVVSNTPVAHVNGALSGITLTISSGTPFGFNNTLTTGNDEALMDDCLDLGGPGSLRTLTLRSLPAGAYTVYTYAAAPDLPHSSFTSVSIGGNSQVVGGAWVGPPLQFVQGITHSLHNVNHTGGALAINLTAISGFGSLNGLQILSPTVPCPPGGLASVRVYRVCGNATGAPWSWQITTTGPAMTMGQWSVAGVGPFDDVDGDGTPGTARDVAKRFADSINAYSAAAGCGANLRAMMFAAGGASCSPPVPTAARLRIRVRGVTGFTLSVGPVGNPNCAVAQLPACGFNPTIQEIDPCPGDIDGGDGVSQSDLGILLANFGMGGADLEQGDLNDDGVVDQRDLGILLANFGSTCP